MKVTLPDRGYQCSCLAATEDETRRIEFYLQVGSYLSLTLVSQGHHTFQNKIH